MPPTDEHRPDWRRLGAERLDGEERARLEALWEELEPPSAEPPPADLVRSTLERVRTEARKVGLVPWHAMGWRPSLAGAALAAALCVGLALGLLAGTSGMDGADDEAVLAAAGTATEADLFADAGADPFGSDLFGPSSAGLADAWWSAWGGGDDALGDVPAADGPTEIAITRGDGEGGA